MGTNAKMNEFSAAMGLCNLKYVHENVRARRERVKYYIDLLQNVKNIKIQMFDDSNIVYSYGYFPVLIEMDESQNNMRDVVYQKLRNENVFSRKYFFPITSDEECFKRQYEKVLLKNARHVSENILVLPLYPELEFEKITNICKIIKKTLG